MPAGERRLHPGGGVDNGDLHRQPDLRPVLLEDFEQPDGRLLFQWEYTYPDNLLAWLMTFRDQVELLEPASLRQEIVDACRRILRAYAAPEHPSDP